MLFVIIWSACSRCFPFVVAQFSDSERPEPMATTDVVSFMRDTPKHPDSRLTRKGAWFSVAMQRRHHLLPITKEFPKQLIVKELTQWHEDCNSDSIRITVWLAPTAASVIVCHAITTQLNQG